MAETKGRSLYRGIVIDVRENQAIVESAFTGFGICHLNDIRNGDGVKQSVTRGTILKLYSVEAQKPQQPSIIIDADVDGRNTVELRTNLNKPDQLLLRTTMAVTSVSTRKQQAAFFSEVVGRAIAFGGSHISAEQIAKLRVGYLVEATITLTERSEECPWLVLELNLPNEDRRRWKRVARGLFVEDSWVMTQVTRGIPYESRNLVTEMTGTFEWLAWPDEEGFTVNDRVRVMYYETLRNGYHEWKILRASKLREDESAGFPNPFYEEVEEDKEDDGDDEDVGPSAQPAYAPAHASFSGYHRRRRNKTK